MTLVAEEGTGWPQRIVRSDAEAVHNLHNIYLVWDRTLVYPYANTRYYIMLWFYIVMRIIVSTHHYTAT